MLRVTRRSGLVPVWERKLAKYGLAMSQIIGADVQVLPALGGVAFQTYSNDKNLKGNWKKYALKTGLLAAEMFSGFDRVRVRYKPRNVVPLWAANDTQCRALLNFIYPHMDKPASRRYAARMWYMIYSAYRLGRTDAAIAEELGVTVQAVEKALQKARQRGDKLFNN